MKRINLFKMLFVIAITAISFAACNKDDDDPAYVGTWVNTETEDGISYRDKIVLSSGSFENIGSMKVGDLTNWIDLYGMKGNLSAAEDVFTITLTSVGQADIDTNTFVISDMVWYNSGSDEFEEFVGEMGSATMKAQYSLNGSSLTLVPDIDGDGDYDTDETMIYTRQ